MTLLEGSSVFLALQLKSQPSHDVQLHLVPTVGQTQAQLSISELVFTKENWNLPQTVEIHGFANDGVDGDQPFEMRIDSTSDDSDYASLVPSTVHATVRNTDVAPGITIDAMDRINEGSSITASFALTTEPRSNVDLQFLVITGDTQASLSVEHLTFTPQNWFVPQSVAILAKQGDGPDGGQIFSFSVQPRSEDLNYDSLEPRIVTTTIYNGAVIFEPREAFRVIPAESSSLSFRLSTMPSSTVEVTIRLAETTTNVSAVPATFVFTPENWNIPQSWSVNGPEALPAEGDRGFSISAEVSSSDSDYNGNVPILPLGIVTDLARWDGFYDVTFSGTANGGSGPFSISDRSVLTIDHTVANPDVVISGNEVLASSHSEFWGLMMRMTGALVSNSDGSVTASGTWTTSDRGYNGNGTWSAVAHSGIRVSSSPDTINEGESKTISVTLGTRPKHDVRYSIAELTGAFEADTSPDSLLFSPSTWHVPQTITVTGLLGDGRDGNQDYVLELKGDGVDPGYGSEYATRITTVIRNSDSPGVDYRGLFYGTIIVGSYTSDRVSLNITEGGTTAVLYDPETGVLRSTTQQVTFTGDRINILFPGDSPSENLELTGTFENGPGNRSVIVSGVHITGGRYSPGTWRATLDRGVHLDISTPVNILEGNSVNMRVSLTAPPAADVTVTLNPNLGTDRVVLSTSELHFTPDNYFIPQLVTIRTFANTVRDSSQQLRCTFLFTTDDPYLNARGTQELQIGSILDTTLDGIYEGRIVGTIFRAAVHIGGYSEGDFDRRFLFTVRGGIVTDFDGRSKALTIDSAGRFRDSETEGNLTISPTGAISATGSDNYWSGPLNYRSTWTANRISG